MLESSRDSSPHREKCLPVGVVLVLLAGQMAILGLTASAAVFSDNVRVNDVTTGIQVNASVAVASDLSIHAVWEDYRSGTHDSDIYYAKSTDGGKTFGPSVRVTDYGGVGSKQKFPSVAVSANGWIHVVWTDMRDIGLPLDDRIYYSRSEDGGYTFSPNVAISEGSWNWDTFIEFVEPQLVYDDSAGCALHVVWSSFDVAIYVHPNYGVWYDKSTNCGDDWGTDSRLASYATDASISVASNGAIGIAYIGMDIIYSDPVSVLFIMNEGSGWSSPAQVDDDPSNKWFMDASVAIESELLGQPPIYSYRIHVAWADGRHIDLEDEDTLYDWDIYYAFSSDGIDFGPNVRVNDNPEWDQTDQREPWIGQDVLFNPKVAWTDWRNDPQGYRDPAGPPHNADVYFAESSNQGGSFDPSQRVNDDSDPGGLYEQSRPMLYELVADPGQLQGTYIIWQDQRDPPTADFNIYFAGDGDPVLEWCGYNGWLDDGVHPDTGDTTTMFTYCVLYRSPVGDPPATDNPRLQIWKGTQSVFYGPMTFDSMAGPSWVEGGYFKHSTPLSDPGADYSYSFLSTDDSGRDASPLSGYGPTVSQAGCPGSPPELLNGAVSPRRGTESTVFEFLVTYKDPDNDPPSYIDVEIDGTDTYPMSKVDPSNYDYDVGVDYISPPITGADLGIGFHTFRFKASDGCWHVSSSLYSGPTVETVDWWPTYQHDMQRMGFSTTATAPDVPSVTKKAISNHASYSSPAYIDNKVFIGRSDGKLISYTATLSHRWTFTLAGSDWINWQSPTVAYGNVYISTMEGMVYALSVADGTKVWEYDIANHPAISVTTTKASSPLVAFDKVFVGCTNDLLVALDAHTGTEIWYFQTGSTTDLDMIPALSKGKLIITSEHPAAVWALPVNDPNGDGQITISEKIWYFGTGIDDEPTAVAVKWGRVFFGVEGAVGVGSDPNGGKIFAIGEDNGVLQWVYDIKNDVPGDEYLIRTDPAVVEDAEGKKVFIGTTGYFYCLYAFPPIPPDGLLYWKFAQFELWSNQNPHVFHSSPSLADGKVFFQSMAWDNLEQTIVERVWALPFADPDSDHIMDEDEAVWDLDLGDLNAGITFSSPAIGLSFVFVGVDPSQSNAPHLIRIEPPPP